ncbi:MAG: phosphatidate cytidylyltransferase [Bacteroidota bacterium]
MNEILKRSLTGLIYMFLLVSTALLGGDALVIIFLFLGMICIYEMQKLLGFRSYIDYIVLLILLLAFHHTQLPQKTIYLILPIVLVVKLFLLKDLFTKKSTFVVSNKRLLMTNIYIAPSFLLMSLLPSIGEVYQPELLIGFFALVWINDSFAYLVGKSIGKHKLFERISPKKTIEGFLGGMFFTIVAGLIIYYQTQTLEVYHWLGIAVLVSIFGSLGDLVQSKFKRRANVKDSGRIIPGHGGIFDRMDSTVFSITFVYTFLLILNYVS